MGLDDIKVQYPATKPERMSRVSDRRAWNDNYDAIFRKPKPGTSDTENKEVQHERN